MSPTVDGVFIDPEQIGEGELSENQHIYRENILDHYRKPRNKNVLKHYTCSCKSKNPFCGDELEVFLLVEDRTIKDISFQGSGCAISQASMSMLTKKLKEKSAADVSVLGQEFVLNILGIPIGIVRRKCAMLGLRAVQQALRKNNET